MLLPSRRQRCAAFMLVAFGLFTPRVLAVEFSTPPIAELPQPSDRPRDAGPAKFVDAARGDDAADGSEAHPWRTIQRSLQSLAAGETLYLRGGIYYEHVRCAAMGRADAPITLRSFPGELATIDGGYREFYETPADAWEPVAGSADEYRSTKTYGNIRYALGSFGDSLVGLNTYYHPQDLRAQSEAWVELPPAEDAEPTKRQKKDVEPVYCGPGLWYDPTTQRIHVRLAHTHLLNRPNYQGPTDPRRVPLVVTPGHALPLRFDGAKHVRVQDIVVRGAGHETVLFEQAEHIAFDGVTVWCGSDGIRAIGLRNFTMTGCGVYGNVPPWTFRTDTSLRARPGVPTRDITRLNTHALLVPSSMRESDVYAMPQNDDWEISYCTFSNGHDGVYLGGLNMRFHHNLVEHTQDDGIYLSPMYPSHKGEPSTLYIYQNVIRDVLTAIAFGGPEPKNTDRAYIYRNLIVLNDLVPTGRPSDITMPARLSSGKPMGDHGSPPWSAMWIYHNTVHTLEAGRNAEQAMTGAAAPDRPRYFLNNIMAVGYKPAQGDVGGASASSATATSSTAPRTPAVLVPTPDVGISDGNLYGFAGADPEAAATIFAKYRKSPAFAESAQAYEGGFTGRSLAADPQLNDDEIPLPGSPAVDAGAPVPAEWPDPLRADDAGRPDIGALPVGAVPLRVGRNAAPR